MGYDILDEIRLAGRTLWTSRLFSMAVIGSLAMGLTLTATVLAVVNAYLVRALPYPAADRLYHVIYASPGQPEPRGMSAIDWRALDDVVEVADDSTLMRFYVKDDGYTEEVIGAAVAAGSMEALRVETVAGRSFGRGDFQAGAATVAVIGHSLWRERFGSDPQVLDRVFRAGVNNQDGDPQTFRIIGVLRPDFQYAADLSRSIEVLVPMRNAGRVYLVRLRENVPFGLAAGRISEAARRAASSLPPGWNGVRLESVRDRYAGGIRPLLVAITIAAGLTLAIVCANVAILMLLKAARRQRDVSVRVALGAGWVRILRILLIESVLLCAAALAVSIAVTPYALMLLAPLIEQHLGRPAPGGTVALQMDGGVLAVLSGIGMLMAVLLSLLPLVTVSRRTPATILRQEGWAGAGGTSVPLRRLRSSLIVLELAASLALLVSCGLMVQSALNLVRADLGFRSEHIIRARLALPQRTYPDAQSLAAFYERFVDALGGRSVGRVALANWPPYYAPPLQRLEWNDGRSADLQVSVMAVGPEYFQMLEIPIQSGREFTRADRVGGDPVALISSTLARQLWPNQSAIGQQIRTGEQPAARSPLGDWRTVVGVVSDVRQNPADIDVRDVYIPFLQAPNQYAPIFIESDRPAALWTAILREALAATDPDGLVSGITTLRQEGDRLLAPARFLASILTGFAAVSVLLTVLGICAVTGYAAQQRAREVAIRLALGATPRRVVGLFLKDSGIVLLSGLAVGLLAAALTSRLLAAQLYGIQALDASTLLTACAAMTTAAFVAAWLPARSAAVRHPIEALKDN